MELTQEQKIEFSFRTRKLREYDLDGQLAMIKKSNEISVFFRVYAFVRDIALAANIAPPVSSKLLQDEFKLTEKQINACIKVMNTMEKMQVKRNLGLFKETAYLNKQVVDNLKIELKKCISNLESQYKLSKL